MINISPQKLLSGDFYKTDFFTNPDAEDDALSGSESNHSHSTKSSSLSSLSSEP